MPVIFAYIFLVCIWATTPLAIQWSNSSLTFVASISLRSLVALIVCSALLLIFRIRLVQRREDWVAFFAGMVGLYPNMLLVYWSSQFISSGLMAVILGVYPFAVGLFSLLIKKENVFNSARVLALCLALGGLVVINIEQLSLGRDGFLGVICMLASALLFAFSTVWVNSVGGSINPLRQSTGVLLLSVPAFILTWFFVDGELPKVIDTKSLIGLSYLSIAGSVIGHTLFFYVLRHCSMVSVSLIPLITPVMALSIGAVLAKETVSVATLCGSLMVLVSLALYQGVFQLLRRKLRSARLQLPGYTVLRKRLFLFVGKVYG